MDDRQVAITSVGTEGELLIGIKSVRVHAFADGWHMTSTRKTTLLVMKTDLHFQPLR